jgi:iron complex outermembrane receptor protein
MKNSHTVMKLTMGAIAIGIAFPVLAEEVSKKPDQIQEVVITASKRKESMQSVPMSVDAVTAESLKKLNIQQFADVEKLSPGLVLNTNDGRGQNISLRGVIFDPDTSASPAVQVYWNETPINTSDAFRSLFDIGRIEVLRGPQGTLRGQTSPAGAITVATRQPDLSGFEGSVSQTIGQRNMWNTQAAVNVPLIPGKLAVRVAALYDRDKDGVHNVVNGRDNIRRSRGGRVSVLYQPIKDLEFLLVHQQLTDNQVNYSVNVGAPVAGQGNGPTLTPRDYKSVLDGPYDFYNRSQLTSLNATWNFSGHKLSYIGGIQQSRESDLRDLDIVIPKYSNTQEVKLSGPSKSHELRIESTDNLFWNYMFGYYFSSARISNEVSQSFSYQWQGQFEPPLSATLTGYGSPNNFMKSNAFFTDHRFALTPNDILEVGLRHQKNESYGQQYINIFGSISTALPDDRAHLSSQRWTGSASYKHNFSKDVMTYASYAGGFRPGGASLFVTAQGLDPNILQYKPEKSNSIEFGIKSKLMDRKLTLNADVFQQNIKGYIARANAIWVRTGAVAGEEPGPGPGGTYPADSALGSFSFNTNGDVISRGLEATAMYSIMPGWQATLSASYVNTHYNNAMLYCNDSNNDGVPDGDGTLVQPGRQVSLCRSNRRLADVFGNAAGKLNMTLQSEYAHDIGNVEGFVRGLVRYVPPVYNFDRKQEISSFTPVDLFVGVREPGGKWELSLWSKNLFDRAVVYPVPTAYVNGYTGGYSGINQTQRRKVGVTLRYDFDI